MRSKKKKQKKGGQDKTRTISNDSVSRGNDCGVLHRFFSVFFFWQRQQTNNVLRLLVLLTHMFQSINILRITTQQKALVVQQGQE